MDYDKNMCPIINVDGFIEKGKQYDLEIKLPEDNRNVIYGIIKDCYGDNVKDAVVKLIEVDGRERKPVSHTFTDKNGEFVFGPLCPDKEYEIQIWANKVKHHKICTDLKHDGKCLKGNNLNDCDFHSDHKTECRNVESTEEVLPEIEV